MMIGIVKEDVGTYSLTGLTSGDLDIIQEGIIRLFDESRLEEHRKFRRQILQINHPIENELDRIYNELHLQQVIKFG